MEIWKTTCKRKNSRQVKVEGLWVFFPKGFGYNSVFSIQKSFFIKNILIILRGVFIIYLFHFGHAAQCGMQDLSPLTRDRTCAPCS